MSKQKVKSTAPLSVDPPDEKTERVAAVERALSILNAFGREDESLSLSELAQRTGLYKSTLLRLLSSLIRFSTVHQLSDGRYQLGHAVLHWGSIYQASMRLEHIVLPVLEQLALRTGEGASYFRREGDVRLCLYRIDSQRSVRDHMHVGDILPLHTGAAGRVLIQFEADVPPPTSVFISIGEREPDIAAVAAPVFDRAGGVAGSISISGPANRFTTSTLPDHVKAVHEAAMTLTQKLGGPTDKLNLPLPVVN